MRHLYLAPCIADEIQERTQVVKLVQDFRKGCDDQSRISILQALHEFMCTFDYTSAVSGSKYSG